jgi:myomegalin
LREELSEAQKNFNLEMKKWKKQNATLDQKVHSVEKTLARKEEQLKNEKEQRSSLQEELNNISSQHEDSLNNERKETNDKIKNYQSKIDKLNLSIDASKSQIKKYQKQLDSLTSQSKDMNSHINYLEGQLATKEQELSIQNRTIDELRQEIESYETKFGPEAETQSQELVESRQLVDQLRQQIHQFEQQSQMNGSQQQELIQSLQYDLKNRELEIEKDSKMFEEMQRSSEKQIQELEAKLRSEIQTVNNYAQQLQQSDKLRGELDNSMIAICNVYDNAMRHCDELESRIKLIEDKRSESMNNNNTIVNQLQNTIHDKDNEIETTKSQLNEYKQRCQQLESSKDIEIQQLQSKLQSMNNTRVSDYETQINQFNEHIHNIESKLSAVEGEYKKATSYADYLHNALKNKNVEISDLRAQIHKLMNSQSPQPVVSSQYANEAMRPQMNAKPAYVRKTIKSPLEEQQTTTRTESL